ncbi:MAG: DMT family transporter [Planctomycetota bacterium]
MNFTETAKRARRGRGANNTELKSFIAAAGAILMWSFTALLTVKLPDVPSLFLTGATLFLGGLVSLPWMRAWTWNIRFILAGTVAVFFYELFLYTALRASPCIECNMINYLWPLLIVLLSPLFDSRVRLKWFHIAGGFIGFAGAVIAIYNPSGGISTVFYWGYLLALAAAIIWAFYSLYMKRFGNISAWTMGLVCLISGTLALIGSAIAGETVRLSRADGLIIGLIGIGPLGLSFCLWNYAMRNADPRKIGTFSYLAPVLSTFWLSLGTGRALDVGLVIALILVVLGAILGRR